MNPDRSHRRQEKRRWRSLPMQGSGFVLLAVMVSLLIHLASGVQLSQVRPARLIPRPKQNQVKVQLVQKPTKVPEKPDHTKAAKILETPQQETAKPEHADYIGQVDHKVKRETRLSEKVPRERGANPGPKGLPTKTKQAAPHQPKKKVAKKPPKPRSKPMVRPKSAGGKLSFGRSRPEPRNPYEAILPTSMSDLAGQVHAGYQDYVDDKIEEGDRIDINTTHYRYIGYFTNMRKAIELVWSYPVEASRRGMEGEVNLEFAIGKDGQASRIKVIRSSGYDVLDQAIVEAIRLASPFSPLPDGIRKNQIIVTGSFRYVLSTYGSH